MAAPNLLLVAKVLQEVERVGGHRPALHVALAEDGEAVSVRLTCVADLTTKLANERVVGLLDLEQAVVDPTPVLLRDLVLEVVRHLGQGGGIALRIDNEMRALARERDHFLWSLTLDGRQRQPPSGVLEIAGPLPPECCAELKALVDRWTREGKV